MGNPYAADFADDAGQVRLGGEITFTDQANQPGGSVPPNNLAVVSLDNAPTFNTDNGWNWQPQPGDLSISEQSGSDFSLGLGSFGEAALLSATGGWFQFGCYFASPGGVTLDGGSTLARWLTLAAVIGTSDDPNILSSFGIDLFAPVDAASSGAPAVTVASVPGYVAPGGPVLRNILFAIVNATGTDVVTQPLAGFSDFAVWQIPALA